MAQRQSGNVVRGMENIMLKPKLQMGSKKPLSTEHSKVGEFVFDLNLRVSK